MTSTGGQIQPFSLHFELVLHIGPPFVLHFGPLATFGRSDADFQPNIRSTGINRVHIYTEIYRYGHDEGGEFNVAC